MTILAFVDNGYECRKVYPAWNGFFFENLVSHNVANRLLIKYISNLEWPVRSPDLDPIKNL